MRALLLAFSVLPLTSFALGVPRTCPLKSQQIKLARECFSGDMRAGDDYGTFLGLDETSKDDMNYCYNAFVIVHPKRGNELQLSVLKDNQKGELRIYNYNVPDKILAKPRSPTSRAPLMLTFRNLRAECFAKRFETDKCSKGVFGFGNTDLPMTVELTHARTGFSVKGHVRDSALVKSSAENSIEPRTLGDVTQTDQWLLQVVRQRLVSAAQRKLATAGRSPAQARAALEKSEQFRYCRMALEGFLVKKKIQSPFTDAEKKMFEQIEALSAGPDLAKSPSAGMPSR